VRCYTYPEIQQRLDDDFSGRRSFNGMEAEKEETPQLLSKG
jgi:hypothetical protein